MSAFDDGRNVTLAVDSCKELSANIIFAISGQVSFGDEVLRRSYSGSSEILFPSFFLFVLRLWHVYFFDRLLPFMTSFLVFDTLSRALARLIVMEYPRSIMLCSSVSFNRKS